MREVRPITDGDWWTADKASWIKCDLCHRLHRMRPTVLYYRPELDFGNAWERKHPGVSEKGWLLWGWCPKRRKDYLEVVGLPAIKRWDTTAEGKWHIKRPSRKGYLPDDA